MEYTYLVAKEFLSGSPPSHNMDQGLIPLFKSIGKTTNAQLHNCTIDKKLAVGTTSNSVKFNCGN